MTELDPRLRRLIEQEKPGVRPDELTAVDVRAADAAILSLQGPVPALHSASDLTIPVAGGIDGRLYRPAPDPLPVLLYFHGGGFVIGSEGYEQPLRDRQFRLLPRPWHRLRFHQGKIALVLRSVPPRRQRPSRCPYLPLARARPHRPAAHARDQRGVRPAARRGRAVRARDQECRRQRRAAQLRRDDPRLLPDDRARGRR